MYYDQVHDIHLVSKMGQIIKVQRPVSSILLAACIIGLDLRPVWDIRGRIYNSFAGDIIVQS